MDFASWEEREQIGVTFKMMEVKLSWPLVGTYHLRYDSDGKKEVIFLDYASKVENLLVLFLVKRQKEEIKLWSEFIRDQLKEQSFK